MLKDDIADVHRKILLGIEHFDPEPVRRMPALWRVEVKGGIKETILLNFDNISISEFMNIYDCTYWQNKYNSNVYTYIHAQIYL